MTNRLVEISGYIISWPPHCCVPAFLYYALGQCGVDLPDPMSIPQLLDIKVGSDDYNPLHLSVTADTQNRGITREQAVFRINDYLRRNYPNLAFRHIPFNVIPFEMYSEVLVTALESGLVVGVGVNYAHLDNRSGEVCRHVLRICSYSNGKVLLYDDSHEVDPPQFEENFCVLERAVKNISDGFWIVGDHQKLILPYAPLYDLQEGLK